MKPIYDSRTVLVHDANVGASVFLMNEAPGPDEAASGVPSFGRQGANIFHTLRYAGISWAVTHQNFVWPIKNGDPQQSERHRHKAEFLATRARYITCTNAFPRWPKPSINSEKFCQPLEGDVIAPDGNFQASCRLS